MENEERQISGQTSSSLFVENELTKFWGRRMIRLQEGFGINTTLDKIRRRFYWPTCKQDMEKWCKTSRVCVSKKRPLEKEKSPLQIYNVETPFERLQMDILDTLSTTAHGNRYLLVIVDCFIKWVKVFPLKILG